MNDAESIIKATEETQSAEEFIATIAPMTAKSGQVDILRELGSITDRDSILETWCGGGDLTAQLAQIAGRVVGTDYSEKLINAARRRFPHIEFVVSVDVVLDFPDSQFDIAVSNFAAHHYSHPHKHFGEAKRVLKAGGRYLVTIPIQTKRVGFNIILDIARKFLDLPPKVITGGPLLGAENPDEIIAIMRGAGFRKCEGYRRTNYTVLESVDTLLEYAWKKLHLDNAPREIQQEIRARSIESAQVYRSNNGSYRFPDQILAVRGDT